MRAALLYCLAQARIADLSRHTPQALAVAAEQTRHPPSKNRAPARWPLAHRNPR